MNSRNAKWCINRSNLAGGNFYLMFVKKGIDASIDENVNFVVERRQITFVYGGPHFKIPMYLQSCSLESLTTLSTLLLRCNNSLL